MEILKTRALVLRSNVYGDKNRIIELYSADRGKIAVSCKGCNSTKSKLLPSTAPKVFAEYELSVTKDGRFLLTGYNSTDLFFELSQNVDKYYVSEIMLELFDKTVPENTLDTPFFVYLIRCFSRLKTSVCPAFDLVKFYLYVMNANGVYFALDDKCACCGKTEILTHYGFTDQGFICADCVKKQGKIMSSIVFSREEIELLKLVSAQDEDDGAAEEFGAELKSVAAKLDRICQGIIGLNSVALAQYMRL